MILYLSIFLQMLASLAAELVIAGIAAFTLYIIVLIIYNVIQFLRNSN
jgi:glucokinase